MCRKTIDSSDILKTAYETTRCHSSENRNCKAELVFSYALEVWTE
jgi:hypothetical protein